MNSQSELGVIVKAKDLCSYIMIITQKSPKHFRYTFVSRMQNLSLDIIEKIYKHKLLKLKRDYADNSIDYEDVKQVTSSYHAHLCHGHTYKLRKKILNDFVLHQT